MARGGEPDGERDATRRPGRENFSFEALPLDDPKVYRLFSDGLTEAVFQFESRGMQGMCPAAVT